MKIKNNTLEPILQILAGSIAVISLLISFKVQAQENSIKSINLITKDLYEAKLVAQYGNLTITTRSLFLVTPEGIILADPLNNDFAKWLKNEFDRRFKIQVKYVIYSHHHADHSSGGAVFAETAVFVGHKKTLAQLTPPAQTPLNGTAISMDSNGNGIIELEEATGTLKTRFTTYDSNSDKRLTGAEIAVGPFLDVVPPSIVYSDRLSIELGGKIVELVHVAPNHSDDMTVVLFPMQKTLFAVDFVFARRLPYLSERSGQLIHWIESTKQLENIDFQYLAPGHGMMGNKEDLIHYRQYLEDLFQEVSNGIKTGRTVTELQQTIMLDDYKHYGMYEQWLKDNIAATYSQLSEPIAEP